MLRCVEPKTSYIREDLVTFLECDSSTSITGDALADQILDFITNHLDPSKMRGQAYDGASNTSDKTNGTADVNCGSEPCQRGPALTFPVLCLCLQLIGHLSARIIIQIACSEHVYA